ncbi:hypothetical protein [Carnobacterium maltaromaticum]|uniref:hypothetical protein n=1 Tax=Carnobacterium maltaromaticum TaxID=2751 RepID=UPI001072B6F0|nr:hypothetical protein [Carnobacterium maltaromaticum]TFJ76281.1 hypothetical protein CKN94_02620 [Carnobacterium maltaromaticum]TFJ79081.1 hypothetical protein CKN97_02615 [Carnobacterium maltaromaticum]
MNSTIFSQEVQEKMAQSIMNLIEVAIESKTTIKGSLQPENAAEYADVSVDTLIRWEKLGLNYSKIKSIKLYSIKDLDDFIAKYKFKN